MPIRREKNEKRIETERIDHQHGALPLLSRSAQMGIGESNVGAIKQWASDGHSVYMLSGADGDIIELYFICDSNETEANFLLAKDADAGIIDIYVNNIEVSSNVDLYAASTTTYNLRLQSLTFNAGQNIIKFVVDGKNALSTGYRVYIRNVGVQ